MANIAFGSNNILSRLSEGKTKTGNIHNCANIIDTLQNCQWPRRESCSCAGWTQASYSLGTNRGSPVIIPFRVMSLYPPAMRNWTEVEEEPVVLRSFLKWPSWKRSSMMADSKPMLRKMAALKLKKEQNPYGQQHNNFVLEKYCQKPLSQTLSTWRASVACGLITFATFET
ncbi:hypothetical protein CHS0354_002306 [Potamilus streckersoni]|uniref:Uncharacterized protein n=1 Tax=Potamilus streckersoni TaxID=2493646 RepID=A0AAE0VZ00_9BIVA|nr:hypothetical protein CHS0354_002306 [Potamilus streckersoni]